MDLLVFILSLGHSKRIKVEPFTYICFLFRLYIYSRCIEEKKFVRDTRNKFQQDITLFTKYFALYNN